MSKVTETTPTTTSILDFIEDTGDLNHLRSMVMIAAHKVGKTSSLVQLENSLIIDLEKSAGYYKGGKTLNIEKRAIQASKKNDKDIHPCEIFMEFARRARSSSDLSPDYIVIDSLTRLSDYADYLAMKRYKESPMGKDWEGTSIMNLPRGAGYGHHRQAMLDLIDMWDFAEKCLILTAHAKDGQLQTPSGEITVNDINLVGQLKLIIPSRVDGIGMLRVDKDNPYKRVLSFKKHSTDLVTGTRVQHLANKEIVISELQNPETDKEHLVTYWDKVFTD